MKKINPYEMEQKNKFATRLLTTAFFMAALGLVVGRITGQDIDAPVNKFVVGLLFLALVFRARLTIIRTAKSWVKAIVG